MKNHFALFVFVFIYRIVFSQSAPEIEWQNTIGGNGEDNLICIQNTADHGYILGGYSSTGINGDKTEINKGGIDYWIVKLDSLGNIEWQNTIGGGNFDWFRSIEQTTDHGYIIGGSSWSEISGDKTEPNIGNVLGTYSTDYWIVKLDSLGNIEWQNTIGGNHDDQLLSIHQTSDQGYIVGGTSDSGISGDKTESNINLSQDYWILKLDSIGNILWQNTIGGNVADLLSSVDETSDNGYILLGSSFSSISADKTEDRIGQFDYWVVKVDSTGNILWQNTIGGNSYETAISIQQTQDNGYILGGHSRSNISGDKTENCLGLDDFWIIKLDSLGNILWQNTIGGTGYDSSPSIEQIADGNYIIGGTSHSGISADKSEENLAYGEYWVIKMDTIGNIIWENTIKGSGEDNLNSIHQSMDGGFILGGFSSSGISGDKTEPWLGVYDYWVIKLYPECIVESNITPSGPTAFCAGESVILNAPLGASYTYQWKKNGVNIPGSTASSFTANVTGQYQVFISNGTCDDISDSLLVIKNPKPNPTITNVDATNDLCFDTAIKLKTAATAGSSYQWYKGAVAISGATTNVYPATTMGNYKVKVTNSAGCFKLSSPYMIIKTCRLGDEQSAENASVTLYPNPNNGHFDIALNGFDEGDNISLNIKNMIGEEIYTEEINNSDLDHQIRLADNIPAGIYLIYVQTGNKTFSQNIILDR